jgi:hypothetical protein
MTNIILTHDERNPGIRVGRALTTPRRAESRGAVKNPESLLNLEVPASVA